MSCLQKLSTLSKFVLCGQELHSYCKLIRNYISTCIGIKIWDKMIKDVKVLRMWEDGKLTLYHTIHSLNDPEEKPFENIVGKGENAGD